MTCGTWTRRLSAMVAVAVMAVGVGAASASAQTLNLPDSTSGVHAAVPFLRCVTQTWAAVHGSVTCPASQANTSVTSLQGKVDVGFMWTYGKFSPTEMGTSINLGAALKIDRFPGYAVNFPRYPSGLPLTLSDWQTAHPDWIEYTCATNSQGQHTTPSWEYGDVPASASDEAYLPFDIDNPSVRQFFFDNYVRPSLDDGYRIIMFDNVSVSQNSWNRCGHYDANGNWVQEYSGARFDSQYQSDMLSWLKWLTDQIHAYAPDALIGVNYDPIYNNDAPSLYQQVFNIVDLVWQEGGFTDWGQQNLTGQHWLNQFQAMSYVSSQSDKALILNDIEGSHSNTDPNAVTPDEREWSLANYLLVKGAHTYLTITPNAYGSFYDYPEYRTPIGSPTGTAFQGADGVWTRNFTGGTTMVNPTSSSQTVTVPAGDTDLNGNSMPSTVTMSSGSGLVILSAGVASAAAARTPGDPLASAATLSPTDTTVATPGGGPVISQASLTGVAKSQPRLAFTVSKGQRVKTVRTITVALTRALRYSLRTKPLSRRIVVTGDRGRHLAFTARVSRTKLTIRLRRPAAHVRVSIRSPRLAASRRLTINVRRHRAGIVRAARVAASNSFRASRAITLKLRPR